MQPEDALAAMMPSTPMPPTPAPPTPMMPSTPLMSHIQPQTPLGMMSEENGHVSMPPPSIPSALGYPGTPAALGYPGAPLQHIDDMPHLPADQVSALLTLCIMRIGQIDSLVVHCKAGFSKF